MFKKQIKVASNANLPDKDKKALKENLQKTFDKKTLEDIFSKT